MTARENEPRVAAVGSALPWPYRVQMPLLRRVVGPLRRRFWKVEPNPPPLTAEEILHRLVIMPVTNCTSSNRGCGISGRCLRTLQQLSGLVGPTG